MNRKLWPLLALAALSAPALAQVYKCPDASGRTVLQQAPCAGGAQLEVKPASGHAPRPVAAASSSPAGAKPMTEAQRLNALSDASARNRRKQDLDERMVPRARTEMYAHRDQCRRTQEQLRADQYRYEQNLYGKTHAAQRASEMAAQSAQCDTRDRELTTAFTTLLGECKQLGGCATITP